MKAILGVNYNLSPVDFNDAILRSGHSGNQGRVFLQLFKQWMESRYDVEIHTYDCVDWMSPQVKAVLYFDYNWRNIVSDKILSRIPFEKRALMLIEPANINPTLYYVPWLRNRFKTVFTWDEGLLATNPQYIKVNVPVGAEPSEFKENRFGGIPFHSKKLLIAISRNKWSYMFNSTYGVRTRVYSFFDKNYSDDFDLFGSNWNRPAVFYQRFTGYPHYCCYRGELTGDHWRGKVARMAKYKFALCYENNASEPGYISEKITDCFCARCVPIYYGSKGVEKRIPTECWIDARQFQSNDDMAKFIVSMTPRCHARYLEAIEDFMHSPALNFFSTENYFRTLAEGLGLKRIFV